MHRVATETYGCFAQTSKGSATADLARTRGHCNTMPAEENGIARSSKPFSRLADVCCRNRVSVSSRRKRFRKPREDNSASVSVVKRAPRRLPLRLLRLDRKLLPPNKLTTSTDESEF